MPTLTLIDGSSYIFRAYHAIPHLSTSKGVPTNAVYGFTNMVLKALRERAPTHVALIFDARGATFREEIDPAYKAHRPPPPDDLIPQFDLVRKVTAALNVPVLEVEGVEADDVIATLADRAVESGFKVIVVTGDKDFMQLVDPDVELYDSMTDKHTGVKEVEERLGVRPGQVIDYMALIGDAVDNVPGVPGVGPKTAAKLIQQFGSLDALLGRVEAIDKPKLREAILAHREQIARARRLVSLRHDVALEVEPRDLSRRPIDAEACRALFAELEFTRLLRDLPPPPQEKLAAATSRTALVQDRAALERLVQALEGAERAGIMVGSEVGSGDARAMPRHPPFGIAFALPSGAAFYVPTGHAYLGVRQLPADEVWAALKGYLESDRPKYGHRTKDPWHALRAVGIHLRGLAGDAELSSCLLNAARREHALADLARERLRTELPASEIGPGSTVEAAAASAGASADAALKLCALMEPELRAAGLWPLLDEMELPLIPVLARMEEVGVEVDRARLAKLGEEVDRQLAARLAEIFRLAGRSFNVASNPQLAQVLFEELHLPVLKKGKTGPSADQEVLEKLAEQHPLPREILEHRGLAKLKSTYIDALPQLIGPDGRIHTTFHQTGAATGRLSSTDPNLQNIPVRSELGRQIREAFVAGEGCLLLSADYSQIELRILAHISRDPALLDSFAKDEDVHTRTAAEVFGVPPGEVTPEMRRVAKMINFGIAYGQSAYGLSHRLDIPGADAQAIIDRYFQRYAGVRTWLDATIAQARREGQVATLFGRRRFLPEIAARNPAIRQGAERMAVNTPIQGTAADVVKRAMIRADQRLREEKLAARMLLQVHDELLFEAPEGELERVRALAVSCMEGAAELDVRLKVEVGVGRSWAEAH